MIIAIVILIVALIILFWGIGVSNTLNRYQVKINEAKSSVEIMLNKRYDVFTQSQAVVAKFIQHENELFSLTQPTSDANIESINKIASEQSKAYAQFVALGQKYPDLKSAPAFTTLQNQISDENEHFAASKRAYNSNISSYNQLAVSFPDSIIAGIKGKAEQEFIKEDDIEAKKDIKIEF